MRQKLPTTFPVGREKILLSELASLPSRSQMLMQDCVAKKMSRQLEVMFDLCRNKMRSFNFALSCRLNCLVKPRVPLTIITTNCIWPLSSVDSIVVALTILVVLNVNFPFGIFSDYFVGQ